MFRFDHLGLAIREPQEVIPYLKAKGYSISDPLVDSNQEVGLIYSKHLEQPNIELVFPVKEFSQNPINRILTKSPQQFYHLCYRVKSFNQYHTFLKGNNINFTVVVKAKEAILFNGLKVQFIYVKGIGLVELIEDSLHVY